MDVTYYVMYFILPIGGLVCSLLLVKFCCKMFCCISEPNPFDIDEHTNVPIYVIPISTDEAEYGSSDGGSVDMMGASAPPPYDSLDPPTYSEWKWTVPKEDPPAYTALGFTSPEPWQGASSDPDAQHVFWNEL